MKYHSFNNIKLSYLFRDGGNYKTFGYVILSNPGRRSTEQIDNDLRRRLIDGAYFYPEKVNLPVLHHGDEGMWHEYEKAEMTDEEVTDERTIEEVAGLLRDAQVVV